MPARGAGAPSPDRSAAGRPSAGASDEDAEAAELSNGIARGDHDALDRFYRGWFELALRDAGARTRRDEAFCLDVVHDAMLRLVRTLRPLRTRGELDACVRRAVLCSALDALRRESRRSRREHSAARAREDRGERAHTDHPLRDAERLARELNELPPEDRSLLLLRFVLGRTIQAAGEALGMTGDAAHGRTRRALERLRRSMKEDPT